MTMLLQSPATLWAASGTLLPIEYDYPKKGLLDTLQFCALNYNPYEAKTPPVQGAV